MALTRLRMDELVNAWVGDDDTPFQIALLGVFDAAPFLRPDATLDVPRIRRELAVRARVVPALGRRVVWTRPWEGLPVWAPDPSFDPDRHIEAATLPPGSELPDWAANRIVRPLPLDRPLWRAEVVDGLPGQRFAVVIVVHHVAADGVTGVALAGSLLDPSADARPGPSPWRARLRCRRTPTSSGTVATGPSRRCAGHGSRAPPRSAVSGTSPARCATLPPSCAPAHRRRPCRAVSGRAGGSWSCGNRWTSCGGPGTPSGSPSTTSC